MPKDQKQYNDDSSTNLIQGEIRKELLGDGFISADTIDRYLGELLSANTDSNPTLTFNLSHPNSRKDDINKTISQFIKNTAAKKLFIPIYNGRNHFTLLYVKKTEADNSKIDIVYIDPTARPEGILEEKRISLTNGVPTIIMSSLFEGRRDIISLTATTNNQIQTLEQQGQITLDPKLAKTLTEKQQQQLTSGSSSLTTFTNSHCGPFVILLANALANNQLTIEELSGRPNLTILQNDGNPFPSLGKAESDSLGRAIRQQLLNNNLQSATDLLPQSLIIAQDQKQRQAARATGNVNNATQQEKQKKAQQRLAKEEGGDDESFESVDTKQVQEGNFRAYNIFKLSNSDILTQLQFIQQELNKEDLNTLDKQRLIFEYELIKSSHPELFRAPEREKAEKAEKGLPAARADSKEEEGQLFVATSSVGEDLTKEAIKAEYNLMLKTYPNLYGDNMYQVNDILQKCLEITTKISLWNKSNPGDKIKDNYIDTVHISNTFNANLNLILKYTENEEQIVDAIFNNSQTPAHAIRNLQLAHVSVGAEERIITKSVFSKLSNKALNAAVASEDHDSLISAVLELLRVVQYCRLDVQEEILSNINKFRTYFRQVNGLLVQRAQLLGDSSEYESLFEFTEILFEKSAPSEIESLRTQSTKVQKILNSHITQRQIREMHSSLNGHIDIVVQTSEDLASIRYQAQIESYLLAGKTNLELLTQIVKNEQFSDKTLIKIIKSGHCEADISSLDLQNRVKFLNSLQKLAENRLAIVENNLFDFNFVKFVKDVRQSSSDLGRLVKERTGKVKAHTNLFRSLTEEEGNNNSKLREIEAKIKDVEAIKAKAKAKVEEWNKGERTFITAKRRQAAIQKKLAEIQKSEDRIQSLRAERDKLVAKHENKQRNSLSTINALNESAEKLRRKIIEASRFEGAGDVYEQIKKLLESEGNALDAIADNASQSLLTLSSQFHFTSPPESKNEDSKVGQDSQRSSNESFFNRRLASYIVNNQNSSADVNLDQTLSSALKNECLEDNPDQELISILISGIKKFPESYFEDRGEGRDSTINNIISKVTKVEDLNLLKSAIKHSQEEQGRADSLSFLGDLVGSQAKDLESKESVINVEGFINVIDEAIKKNH